MIYEEYDIKTEASNYWADKAQDVDYYEAEREEMRRREWAQRNGNDASFDPYAYCE